MKDEVADFDLAGPRACATGKIALQTVRLQKLNKLCSTSLAYRTISNRSMPPSPQSEI